MTGAATSRRRRSAGQLPPEPETVLQRKIVRLARLLGWAVYHPWTSIHSQSGFPDLVMVRNGRLIFAELKRESCEPTEDQFAWLGELVLVPCAEVFVWRPGDWTEIVGVLR